MGIPWQSDAGSCQAVWTNSQYPVPAWWAANLPIDVLTNKSYKAIKDVNTLPETKRNIYASRQPWLQTTDTGYVGYHAEGGYLNGLINMVYQWDKIGSVAARKLDLDGYPKTVYVSFDGKDIESNKPILLGDEYPTENIPDSKIGTIFYTKTTPHVWIPSDKLIILSASPDGTGRLYIDDKATIKANGIEIKTVLGLHLDPMDLTSIFADHNLLGTHASIEISYQDVHGVQLGASSFFLTFL